MSVDIPVTLRLNKVSEGGAAFAETRESLSGLTSGLQQSTGAILTEREALLGRRSAIMEQVRVGRLFRQDFRGQHEVSLTFARGIGQVGNAFLKVNQLYVGHNLLQQRQTEPDERLRIGKEKLAIAIRTQGADSLAAQTAQANVNRLLNDQKNLTHESAIQYITMGVAATSVFGDIAQAIQTFSYGRFALRERGGKAGVLGMGGASVPGALGGLPNPAGGGSRFLTKGRLIRGGIAGAAGIGAAELLQGSPVSAE